MNKTDEERAKEVSELFNSLTGLEYLKKLILDGDNSPMGKTMNMRVIAAENGTVQIEAIPAAKFYNPMMRIHGGFTAALMDSALGCAVSSTLPEGTGVGTVQLNVNFVRKIEIATGPLIATGTVVHKGRTMLTAEAKLADRAGVLYAHGTGTFLVYPK
jgi:uncharacterized protein (TIGR00369 family)